LLILRRLLLARLPAAGHRADDGADSGARARITRDGADRRAARGSPGGAANSLTAACGWTSLLWWWTRSHDRRINTRSLLCPGVTFCVILFLLFRALTFGGIHDRLLRRSWDCQAEDYKMQHQ